jgi:hypothetical protein
MPRPTYVNANVNRANYDSAVPTPWVNAGGSSIVGGSWWDAAYIGNGSTAWDTQTVTDTNTIKLVSFNVTTLFQAIYDNPNHLSAVIIGTTGAGNQVYAGNGYADTTKRPKINYDGGSDQSITNETGINFSAISGSPNASEQLVQPDLGTSLNWARWILDVPPPATRPTSATLKVYTTQQFGDADIKVFWLRYPPESAPSAITYTYARPTSDITTQWTPSTGIDHYALIDETTANDADYIYATAAGQTDEVRLASMSAPQAGTDLLINYRVAGIVGSASVTMSLRQGSGGTLIATDTAKTSDNTYQLVVPAATWASVTDWTDLRLRFVSA